MDTPMLPPSWQALLAPCLDWAQTEALFARVREARAAGPVFPPANRVFFALEQTPPEAVRVVILGQDPYHEPGQAMGLAFSVPRTTALPPSLRNIYRELSEDLGLPVPEHGDLTAWARQGVLLLNTVLTVAEGRANSHAGFGWQAFTDGVLRSLAALPQPIVFVLWGAQAQRKIPLARQGAGPRHIIASPHPSPLSAYRGFFGSRPFSRVNAFLESLQAPPIRWAL